jgi:hypothetical protein
MDTGATKMTAITFYAPTFIDESMTHPDRRGHQKPTGRLSGMLFTRRFSTTRGGKIRAERGIVSFSWNEDTQEAKAAALEKAIEGMEGELPELDSNPPTNFIPAIVKEKLS